jgi:hypothetical protein
MATMDPKTSPLAQLKDPSLLKTDASTWWIRPPACC